MKQLNLILNKEECNRMTKLDNKDESVEENTVLSEEAWGNLMGILENPPEGEEATPEMKGLLKS